MVMKKVLLSLLLLASVIFAKAGQQINYEGHLFYNSITHQITVELWIINTTNPCGNGNVNLAALFFGLQWNPNTVTLQSWQFIPPGKGLDSSDYFQGGNSPGPDTTVYGTRTISTYSKTDSTIDFTRSTNYCHNTIYLTCGIPIPLFQATFYIDPAIAANYNWTTPSDNTYIAEFNNGTAAPTSNYKDILFIASRPFDQAGNGNVNCPDGSTVPGINNLPDDKAPDIFYNTNAPLPVKLISFEAYKQNNKNILQWQTATELNTKGFEIQRRINGGFETIGYIPSQSVGGYSENVLSYNFTDPVLSTEGTAYYRLRQVNYLAKDNSYSEIKAVRNSKMLQVLVYPNPSNGKINIILPEVNGIMDINMIDFSGKLIRTWTGYKIPNIELSGLQKGIYTLLISNRETGEKVAQKITVE